jgi:hypothetical protein
MKIANEKNTRDGARPPTNKRRTKPLETKQSKNQKNGTHQFVGFPLIFIQCSHLHFIRSMNYSHSFDSSIQKFDFLSTTGEAQSDCRQRQTTTKQKNHINTRETYIISTIAFEFTQCFCSFSDFLLQCSQIRVVVFKLFNHFVFVNL